MCSGALFGYSVGVDDRTGCALIGSVGSKGMGIYKEKRSIYPHYASTLIDFPIKPKYEIYGNAANTQAPNGGNVRLIAQVAHDYNATLEYEAETFRAKEGSVYVFSRVEAIFDSSSNLVSSAYWGTVEVAKFAPPDVFARDSFGHSVAISGYDSVIGAPGVDGGGLNAGAAYVLDAQFQRVSFTQSEYVALEGSDSVTITLQREAAYADKVYTVGYATSDLTAIGIDEAKFIACNAMAATLRDGCGDYQQTSGEATFPAGSTQTTFTINIMNDFCIEHYAEFVQLSLNVVGGAGIQGENYFATLRIDDNDWVGSTSSVLCTQEGIA